MEVVSEGDFEVVLYYTCPEEDTGAAFELSLGKSSLTGKVTESYNPPLQGMEHAGYSRAAAMDLSLLAFARIE